MVTTLDLTTFPTARADATEDSWTKYAKGLITNGVLSGVTNEFLVFGDSTGMQVKVKSGRAYIDGMCTDSTAQNTFAIAAADAINGRIDRIVLRLTTTSPATIACKVITGTAVPSPVAPALLDDATHTDIPLATVAIAALATTIAVGNVTDGRLFTQPGGATNNRMELRGDMAAPTFLDSDGSVQWFAGMRSDITGTDDIAFYAFNNSRLRYYVQGTEVGRWDFDGTNYSKAFYVGDATNWGYQGIRQRASTPQAMEIVNSAGSNATPYVIFAREESPYTETARFDIAAGTFRIGASVSMSGAVTNVIGLSDIGSALTGNPTSGGYLYVTSGGLQYRGSAGTVTNVAPA